MSFKNQRIIFATATLGSFFANQLKAEPLTAWTPPKWGFLLKTSQEKLSLNSKKELTPIPALEIQRNSLHKSLVFDQPSDKVSVRPWDRVEERKVVQVKDSLPTIVSAAALNPEKRIPAISTEAFIKFAAVDATKSASSNSLVRKLSTLSNQSVVPMEEPQATSSAQEIISGSESPDAYISRYTRDSQALAEKLNTINQSGVAFEVSEPLTESFDAPETASKNDRLSSAPEPPSAIGAPENLIPVSLPENPSREASTIRLDGLVRPQTEATLIAKNSPEEMIKEAPKVLTVDSVPNVEEGLRLSPAIIPSTDEGTAKIVLIDEESLATGETMGIESASVYWIGTESQLVTKSQKGGVLSAPYSATGSMRFVVKAPGYLPAVGYVSHGLVSQVMLYKESRLAPVVKSLGIVPDPSRVMLFGKVLDFKGQPVSNVILDASTAKPFKVFYSLGSVGLFHPKASATGPTGDFFVSGINTGIQYFMPTALLNMQNNFTAATDTSQSFEWPAQIINLSGLGPVATITIQQAEQRMIKTQIVDAFSLERPSDVGIQLTIGGQRGVHIPDEEGDLNIPELYRRSSPDLVEVRAQGYLKTWITGSAEKGAFPESVALFTQLQVDTLLTEALADIQLTKGVVFGNLRPEIFESPVEIRVFDSFGKKAVDAKVLYFDERNLARETMTQTDKVVQNFAIANLNPGEWQVIAIDPLSRRAVGAQVVRVENDTVSQLQF